jgi:hypothetical protein
MNKKIIGIFLVMLLIATSVAPVLGIKTTSSHNMIIEIESITTDYLDLVLDPEDPESLNMMDSYYEIYEGLYWKLTVTAYWNPPQPEKQICLWVDPDTLPAGATFPECSCGYGTISGVLEWTPAPGQAGTYEIVFYIGENCYEPLGTNIVTVKVYPYNPDPTKAYGIYEGQSWHIGVTTYWSPPQPERPICLWVNDYTLPEGATFTPECNCGYGQVTSDLYWTPYVCQSGIYTITFYAGETCGEYVFPFSIEVIVFSLDPNINIYQENYRLDDGYTKDSRNGLLELTYDTNPSVEVQYVNFYYNGQWKMKNVPVRSGDAVRSQTICIPFYLDVPDGEDVHMAEYGYEVTTTPQTSPPETIKIKEVLDKENTIYSGEDGADLEYTGITTNPIWFTDYDYTKAGFKRWSHIVNQECGENECAPAAISNSLKMLKKAHPDKLSGLTDDPDSNNDDTDINTMKPVVDWDEDGAPKDNVDSPNAWWNKKKAFMDASDKYPITTEIMSNKSNFDYVIDEIARCQDVELRVWGHVVWVSGMIKTADGKYILEVNHDTNQSNPNGGTQTELVQYDPSTNRFHGSPWVEGRRFHEPGFIESIFIIECPEEEEENDPPETPETPEGETSGETGTSYPYTTSTTDPDGDPVSYGWDFNGDNVVDGWTEYYPSGQEIETYHTWETRGTYSIKVKAKDTDDAESEWSDPLTVSMPKNKVINTPLFFQKIFQRFSFFKIILYQVISIN